MLDSIYHDIKNTLKSHLWCKKVIFLSLCTQLCYGRHNVSRFAWRYFTPRRDLI